MASVLILGAYGLLGCSLSEVLSQKGHIVLRQGRHGNAQVEVDSLNKQWVKNFLLENNIDVVINLIASTNVDQCEADLQYALAGNVKPVEAVVDGIAASQKKIHLIQISTDHVYGGVGPNSEDDVLLLNEYARSKYRGEIVAQSINSTILRTNFFGRSHNPSRASLTDWIINSILEKREIKVFDDVFVTPLHLLSLCDAIEVVIIKGHRGIFNLGCLDGQSKAFLAIELAKKIGIGRDLIKLGLSDEANLIARRPKDMRMISDKFMRQFNHTLPSFGSQIDMTAQEFKNA